MARPCSVCGHQKRAVIDRALVTRSDSMRNIAEQFGVSTTALSRHKSSHIPRLVQVAQDVAAEEAVGLGKVLVRELDLLRERTRAILEQAEAAGELRTALQAIRELRETIKTQHELGATAELETRMDELERMLAETTKRGRARA